MPGQRCERGTTQLPSLEIAPTTKG